MSVLCQRQKRKMEQMGQIDRKVGQAGQNFDFCPDGTLTGGEFGNAKLNARWLRICQNVL